MSNQQNDVLSETWQKSFQELKACALKIKNDRDLLLEALKEAAIMLNQINKSGPKVNLLKDSPGFMRIMKAINQAEFR